MNLLELFLIGVLVSFLVVYLWPVLKSYKRLIFSKQRVKSKTGTTKDATDMTRKEIENVPQLDWDETVECSSIIIIPGNINDIHDSGYRCMGFVLCNEKAHPFGKISGGSDVVHLDGIGGFGEDWLEKYTRVPRLTPPTGWSIDCLKVSGLIRLFPLGKTIRVGAALSSFEIWAIEKEEKNIEIKGKIKNNHIQGYKIREQLARKKYLNLQKKVKRGKK